MPRGSDGNRCRASEVEHLELTAAQARPRRASTAPSAPPPRARSAPPAPAPRRSPRVEQDAKHLKEESDKVGILRAYAEWVAGGKVKSESPLKSLLDEYKCSKNYPKLLYDKVLETGSVTNNWHQREGGFSDKTWDAMVEIIREHRSRQRMASLRKIKSTLKKKACGKAVPSLTTISRAKKRMGFKKHKVKTKPKLSTKLWDGRWKMAMNQKCTTEAKYLKSVERIVFGDQKWCSEHKGTNDAVEARDDSPIPDTILFRAADHETRTQMVKIMFMFVVTGTKKIGCYELDFKKFNKEHDARTKAGKKAAGVTAAYLKGILKKIAKDARKKLGPGPIGLLLDQAPAHKALLADGSLAELFDGDVELAAGKAPDMSQLDAGICPNIERFVEESGAVTEEEIRAAVKDAWKAITDEMVVKISKRVRKNMLKVIEKKGGNFFHE